MLDPIQKLLQRVVARGIGASDEINPFWQGQLEKLKALLETTPTPSHASIQKALGYASRGLRENAKSNRELSTWPAFKAAIKAGSIKALPSKGLQQHAANLHYLNRKGALIPYLDWLDARGVESDLNSARMYWYSERLYNQLKALGRDHPQNVIELGAGAGTFAWMLRERGLVKHYVIVDLPEMLLNSMITIAQVAPDVDIRLDETPDFSLDKPTFWFLETRDIEKVPTGSVDIATNFQSLMEMDEDIRDFYIGEFYRALRPGGLMYNVNRMQREMTRRNGEPYINNPLLYPYRSTDTVLEWEPDENQESCRAKELISRHASFAISRMHLTKAD